MRLGLGCVALGSAAGRRVADDVGLVRDAVDLGVTLFDTADVYGSGASERVLGRALKGRRDDIVIATKGGFVFRDRTPTAQWARRRAKSVVGRSRRLSSTGVVGVGNGSYDHQDFSPRYLRDAIHASLRRLGTDRIDVYQLHAPARLLPDVIGELDDLVGAGAVVRFGVGAGSVASADAWVDAPGVRVVQVPCGVFDPEAVRTTLPAARAHGVELWARGALGGGLLGLAERDPGAFAVHPKRDEVLSIRAVAAEAGLDPAQLALGYLRSHDTDIAAVIVGSSSTEHVRRNIELLASPPLEKAVLGAVSAVFASASTGKERR